MTIHVRKALFVVGFAVLLSLVLVACSGAQTTPAPTQACPESPTPAPCPTCPEQQPCPEASTIEVPFEAEWADSPHADETAEAFVHWNEDDPAVVPTSCAKCHSTFGMLDFLGEDGTAPDVVDNDAPTGSVITCVACHNDTTINLTSVTFPSGVTVEGLGDESRCMLCHQGRASKVTVDNSITDAGAEDPDTVYEDLGFINIHYFAAAATLYASEVKGGYEYDGKVYDVKNDHVPGYDTCIGCHNPHSLEVRVDECAVCHDGVASTEDIKNIRMVSSSKDYDGDGNVEEGMYYELEGLMETLYGSIQAYASDVVGTGIVYDPASHPYFFVDADGDGVPDQGDSGAVRYTTWTPRLVKAAYNYQVAVKDPGKHAHGNKYIVQLLYDSIEDLNASLSSPVDMSAMARDDAGHFAGNTEPFRHWDAEGEVPGSCAKCHSATGLPTFIKEGVNVAAMPVNGFQCSTCHDTENFPNRYEVTSVTFPSGSTVSFATDADGKFTPDESNLCILCHQGRSSTSAVNRALGDKETDTPDSSIRFTNIHYFAAGATIFGTEVQGAYEYAGKEYLGQNPHPGDGSLAKCLSCHDPHSLQPNVQLCQGCHGTTAPEEIRSPGDTTDYDGDGDTAEGMAGEIETLSEALLAEIQTYAAAAGTGIVYDAASYPYFFVDADGDGMPDEGDSGLIGYNAFTPTLLKAAYNYQYVQKDPGAFVHNPKYVIQFVIDSIQDLGGDVAAYTRP